MNDAMFSAGVDGGQANGNVRAATAASSSTESSVAMPTASVRGSIARGAGPSSCPTERRWRPDRGRRPNTLRRARSILVRRVDDHVVQRVGRIGGPRLVGVGERRHAVEAEVGRHDERIRHSDRTNRHVGALDRAAGKAFDRNAAARVAESRWRVARLHAADGDVCDVGAGIHPQRVTDVADRRVTRPRAGAAATRCQQPRQQGGQDDQPAAHLRIIAHARPRRGGVPCTLISRSCRRSVIQARRSGRPRRAP